MGMWVAANERSGTTESSPPPTDISNLERQVKNQARIVDQSMSMQSVLRDRDTRIGTAFLCGIIGFSIVGAGLAFAGTEEGLKILGVRAARATWIAWLTIGTTILAIVELIVDRRGAAQRRDAAVRTLASLKAEFAESRATGLSVEKAARLAERYGQAMESIPPVPERLFNRLKSKHLMKIEISKLLSSHPGLSSREARRLIRRKASRDAKSVLGGS
jgi:hypothetical protein